MEMEELSPPQDPTSAESPPDYLPNYKAVRVKLSDIVRNDASRKIISDTVAYANRVTIHTMQFMKQYLLHCYDKNEKIPNITKEFAIHCLGVVGRNGNIGGSGNTGHIKDKELRDSRDNLVVFFNATYKNTMHANDIPQGRKYATRMFEYLGATIAAEYRTNIKQHYVKYVERFINVLFGKKGGTDGKTDAEKNAFFAKLRKYKTAVLERRQGDLPDEVKAHFSHIIVQRPFAKSIEAREGDASHVYYDIACHPFEYLPCMIYMMRYVESRNEKLYNVFPLRTSIAPKYVRFDTLLMIGFLTTSETRPNGMRKLCAHINATKEQIWGPIFTCKSPASKSTARSTNSHI